MSGGPCPDCFSGTEHAGNPMGTVTTLHGLQVYVAHPEGTPKGLVVMIPDAFGFPFVNNRVLCDRYAKRGGFLVYLPEFMNGYSMSPALLGLLKKITTPASWFETIFYKPLYVARMVAAFVPFVIGTRRAVCWPRIVNFFQALRTSPPPFPTSDLKIGTAGFCWGGQHVVRLAHDPPEIRVVRHESQTEASSKPEPLIDCGFTAHPSFLVVPKDIEPVQLPLSVSIGDDDMQMKAPKILETKELLEVKKKGDHEVVILPGAKHGFAIRTDPADKYQMECAAKAEDQAISWFTKWLA